MTNSPKYISRLIVLLAVSMLGVATILPGQVSKQDWGAVSLMLDDQVEGVIPVIDSLLGQLPVMDSTDIMQAIRYRGLANRRMGNYVQSIGDFTIIRDYARSKRDSLLWAEAADQIGIMNTFMGNMMIGQTFLIEVAELYQEVGSPADIAGANNGLAIFYNDIGRIDEAIELYGQALRQYQAIDDTLGQANVYGNLGLLYIDEKKYDKAGDNLMLQGHLDSLVGSQWGLGFHHDWLGILYHERGDYDKALHHYDIALNIRKRLPSHYNLAETRSGLSGVYLSIGQYDDAIAQAMEILRHKEDHQSLSQQMSAYHLLSQAYEKQDDPSQGLQYYKEYKEMSDSIYQRDMLSEIANKDALYQRAKQDREIARLDGEQAITAAKITNKNRIIRMAGIALALISLLLLLLYRLYRKVGRQKDVISKALSEKDLLLREIHHRVKNNLQLVSGLLTLQGRSINDEMAQQAIQEGKSRVRSMALIHQDLYNREKLTHIGVKQYIEKLSRELFQTYRIDNEQISLQTDINNIDLDIDVVIPLGLIINELISNSLKYAFPLDRPGSLSVSLREDIGTSTLVLVVSDDGIGYDTSAIRSNSFGSTLVASLTEQLDGSMVIASDSGTTTTISMRGYH
jgi:two-component sensor histidine kinase